MSAQRSTEDPRRRDLVALDDGQADRAGKAEGEHRRTDKRREDAGQKRRTGRLTGLFAVAAVMVDRDEPDIDGRAEETRFGQARPGVVVGQREREGTQEKDNHQRSDQ